MWKRILCLTAVLLLLLGCAAAEVSVGDTVTFGTYPQTAQGRDKTPIEWLVLDVNEEEGSALLLSRMLLDAQTYYFRYKPVTWAESSLREWLNGKFMKAAFSRSEKKAILTTRVSSADSEGGGWSTPGGESTKDQVFLLSCREAERYLGLTAYDPEATALTARAVPTDYAAAKGVDASAEYGGAAIWWLRSPGIDSVSAAVVGMHGMLTTCSVGGTYVGVRPALWVKVSALQ